LAAEILKWLHLAVLRYRDAGSGCAHPRKYRKSFLSTVRSYFRNGPNAAATSVAPTL